MAYLIIWSYCSAMMSQRIGRVSAEPGWSLGRRSRQRLDGSKPSAPADPPTDDPMITKGPGAAAVEPAATRGTRARPARPQLQNVSCASAPAELADGPTRYWEPLDQFASGGPVCGLARRQRWGCDQQQEPRGGRPLEKTPAGRFCRKPQVASGRTKLLYFFAVGWGWWVSGLPSQASPSTGREFAARPTRH